MRQTCSMEYDINHQANLQGMYGTVQHQMQSGGAREKEAGSAAVTSCSMFPCQWSPPGSRRILRTPSAVLLILLPTLPPPDTWWLTLETLTRGVPEAEL